ncbi:MAG: rod shape-determining protein RodA [Vulcanimicrobiota bacterium]
MNKPWWKKIDYSLLFMMLVLIVFGLVMIHSSTLQEPESNLLQKQLLFFGIGLILLFVFARLDYGLLAGFERYFYIINLVLLIAILFVGEQVKGAQRWISLGPFSFQPSEFTKIVMILSLSHHLAKEDALKKINLIKTFVYLTIPMLLIMLQPDLSTALVLMAIFFAILFVRGINPLVLVGTALAGIATSPFILKDYQKQRLLIFLDPYTDSTGAGWNIIQSIIGIGSGKLWGKGLFSGTQIQLKFIPEHSTDFIFTVLGEELGFIGTASLVVIFFFLMWKTIKIASNAKDSQGTLIAVGIAAMFFFQIFINIGMTIGIMPVTGIPLPFLSYGGSSLITNMIAIGLLLNIHFQKESFFKSGNEVVNKIEKYHLSYKQIG